MENGLEAFEKVLMENELAFTMETGALLMVLPQQDSLRPWWNLLDPIPMA